MRHDFDIIDEVAEEAIVVRRHGNERIRALRGKAIARREIQAGLVDLLIGAAFGFAAVALVLLTNGGGIHG